MADTNVEDALLKAAEADYENCREQLTAARAEGEFLLDRLSELEIPEEIARDWMGHVEPAIERFRAALTTGAGEKEEGK